jgi:hypothetical protein
LTNLFITFRRTPWYRKKRFAIPLGFLIIICFGAIIIGAVSGSKAAASKQGKLFISSGSQVNDNFKGKYSLIMQ